MIDLPDLMTPDQKKECNETITLVRKVESLRFVVNSAEELIKFFYEPRIVRLNSIDPLRKTVDTFLETYKLFLENKPDEAENSGVYLASAVKDLYSKNLLEKWVAISSLEFLTTGIFECSDYFVRTTLLSQAAKSLQIIQNDAKKMYGEAFEKARRYYESHDIPEKIDWNFLD